ncbi:MAG: CDP-alcohol phosphatidyltransferase family protein [Ignavibacteria bacterium]|jgi:phosphatidylglycerophosphate synthase|nr:CDP-alcohol phosphatidyltransferase family protein [Ignavibacteria bacterium]MDH7527969.1 CDP-alcohol phosphatidyltransferase family protein [Ignavibacteria bacterium]
MDKLPPSEKFFDVSDYSRPFSRHLVKLVINTSLTPIFFTTISLISGILAAILIYLNKFNFIIAILILLKSFFDAVDGELARARNRPSYVGRFYDSVVDFFVNVLIFLSLAIRFEISAVKLIVVIILFHLQGSIYNYYYVLKRHKAGGDKTSRIDERKIDQIYPYDNPFWFKVFHTLYVWIYSWQDLIIHKIDSDAENLANIPNSFMTLTSFLGLGTQLLLISIFTLFSLEKYIVDFFIYFYSLLAIGVILIRKIFYH